MSRNRFIHVTVFWIALLLFTTVVATAESPTRVVELQFINHLQGSMPEQDVYIENENGQVVRVAPDAELTEAMQAQMAYAATEAQAHDLFALGEHPFGPFDKGQELGFSLGEWLSAKGSGTYIVNGDRAELDLAFENLVPNGVYTVWCAFVNVPPAYSIVDKPCGAEDGSENTVIANADGTMSYQLELNKLPDSTDETITVVAIAYHSDGKTYGAYPGDFGLNSHVQLVAMMPQPEPEVMPETGADRNSSAPVGLIVAAGALMLVTAEIVRRKRATA